MYKEQSASSVIRFESKEMFSYFDVLDLSSSFNISNQEDFHSESLEKTMMVCIRNNKSQQEFDSYQSENTLPIQDPWKRR